MAAAAGAGTPGVAGGGSSSSTSSLASRSSPPSQVKQWIADAVRDKQEAVAVTTEIQEEILREMGIDPSFGIGCLGKMNLVYDSDMDLMIKFYQFVAKEEMAIDEAELEPREFAEKIHAQQKLQEQQLKMLVQMRKYTPESQSVILETLRKQLESANFDTSASILTSEQIQEAIQKQISFSKVSRTFITDESLYAVENSCANLKTAELFHAYCWEH